MRQTVCSVLHSNAIQISERRDTNFLFELCDQVVRGNLQLICHVLHGDCLCIGVLQIIQCTDRQATVAGGLFAPDGLTVFANQPFMLLVDFIDAMGVSDDSGADSRNMVIDNRRNSGMHCPNTNNCTGNSRGNSGCLQSLP